MVIDLVRGTAPLRAGLTLTAPPGSPLTGQ